MSNSLNYYCSPAQQVSEVWSGNQKEVEPKKNGKTEVPQSRRNKLNMKGGYMLKNKQNHSKNLFANTFARWGKALNKNKGKILLLIGVALFLAACEKEKTCDVELENWNNAKNTEAKLKADYNTYADSSLTYFVPLCMADAQYGVPYQNKFQLYMGGHEHTRNDSLQAAYNAYKDISQSPAWQTMPEEGFKFNCTGSGRTAMAAQDADGKIPDATQNTIVAQKLLNECQNSN